jgi:hypothetical protein
MASSGSSLTTMPPDGLAKAAALRSQRTLERAQTALSDLTAEAEPISFQAVARRANVSRQWLYQVPELRREIERLRDSPAQRAHVPTPQRASERSLRQRVEPLLLENRRLRTQNADLREELALAYDQSRAAPTQPTRPPPGPPSAPST